MNSPMKEPRYVKINHYKKKCEEVETNPLSASASSCSVSSDSCTHNSNLSNDMNSCKREEVKMKRTPKRLTEEDSSSNGCRLKEEDSTKRFKSVKTRRHKRRSSESRSVTVIESASGGTNEKDSQRMKLDYKNGKGKAERKNSTTKKGDIQLEGRKRNALFSIKGNERSDGLRGTLEREREEEKNRGQSKEKNEQSNCTEKESRNRRRESPKHNSVYTINGSERNWSDDSMGKSERTCRGLKKENADVKHRKREHFIETVSEERIKKKHKFSESSESDKSSNDVRHTTNRKKTKRSVTPNSSISGNVGSDTDSVVDNIPSSRNSSSRNSSSRNSSSLNSSSRNSSSSNSSSSSCSSSNSSGISKKDRNRSRNRSYGKRKSYRNYKRRDSFRTIEKDKKGETGKKGQKKGKGSIDSESSEEVKERKTIQRKNKNVKNNVKETEHRSEYKRRSLSSVSKSVSTLCSETEKKRKRLKKEKRSERSSSSDNSDIKKKKNLKERKYAKSEISSLYSRSVTLSSSEETSVERNNEKKKKGNVRSLKMNKMEKKSSDISSIDSEETSTDSGQEMKRKTNGVKRKHVSRNKDRRDKYHEDISTRKNEMNKLKEKEEEYDPVKEDDKAKMEINEDLIEYAKKKIANVTVEDVGKFGGVYIPPFKIERLKSEVTDTKSVLYQRQEWVKLKKKINNIVNKVNVDNIGDIVYELLECNLIRGKGLFSRALIHAQLSSPAFTNVFASLLAIVNSKFPNIGLLTVQRVILHFRRAYKRNDKITCYSSVKFIAHMINQRVLHEIVGLQLCSLLLQNITNDSVQVCTFFIAEVGQLYTEICRKGLDLIFERLKDILQEGKIQIKTQYDIEKLWDYRKNNFEKFPTVIKKLDLIDDDDKIVHEIDILDESFTNEEELNIFREVPPEQYEAENEEWKQISNELLNESDSDEREGTSSDEEEPDVSDDEEENEESDNSSVDSEEEARKKKKKKRNDYENESDSNDSSVEDDKDKEEITDMTEQYLINLRKNVYLSIMSSLSFEECVHKLLKLHIKPGYEIEICNMLIDCCCMEKTFQTFYALQAERLCKLRKCYQECFEKCFEKSYNTAHRLETAKLRNCSKFFAHLLYTDAISWSVFKIITLTEESTTSSTRIFIKILMQELTNNLGLRNLYEKMNHPAIAPFLTGLFPTDSPPNIRFCINYFTAIGLGALTAPLRKLLQG